MLRIQPSRDAKSNFCATDEEVSAAVKAAFNLQEEPVSYKISLGEAYFTLHNTEEGTVEFKLHLPMSNKAINPDTGKAAELPELLKCSDGPHWEE